MNPKLVKFTVELQTGEKMPKEEKHFLYKYVGKYFFNAYHSVPVRVNTDKE